MHDYKAIVSKLYDAFAQGDMPTVLSAMKPDVSWTEAEGFPYGGTFKGPEEVLANVFMKLGTEWHRWSAIPNELVAEGDTVVVLGKYSGTCKETGKFFRAPFVHVWKFSDGQLQTFVQHTDTVLVRRAMQHEEVD